MSKQTITFDDEFTYWRKAHLQRPVKHAPATRITVFPMTKDGFVAELFQNGEIKIRPREGSGNGAPTAAWQNAFGGWINAFGELANIAGRQWGPDWVERIPQQEEED